MKSKIFIITVTLISTIFAFTEDGFSDWTVTPTSIDFGDVPVGTPKRVSLVITNTNPPGGATITFAFYPSIPEVTTDVIGAGIGGISVAPGASIVVVVTFTPTARGNYSGEIVIASNDPTTPSRTVTFTGTSSYATGIDVSPLSINFGSVPVGQSKEEVLRVGNSGNGNLNVTITVTAGTPFKVSKSSFTLRPGQIETIIVTFAPTEKGVYTAALTVVSDDINTPKVVVSLRGDTGIEFGLYFFPTIMNFGYVQINTKSDRLLTFYNISSDIVNVSLFIQNIVGNAFFFSSSVITSFSLIPGEKRQIPVSFYPTDKTSYSGFLYIYTNTGNARISLLGTGSETGTAGLEPQNPPPTSGGGGGGCSISGSRETSVFGNVLLMFLPIITIALRKLYRKIR